MREGEEGRRGGTEEKDGGGSASAGLHRGPENRDCDCD